MAGRQAKILSSDDLNDLLVFASCTRHPLRNRVIVFLAAKAGLRAGEIANLTWDMVVDPTGEIGSVIELRDLAAKNGSGRLIPVHPELRQALAAYLGLSTGSGPVIRSERGGPMTPLSIVVWFNRAFRNIGLHGCSSHSGRRTFITRAARLVHRVGGSLRDVQLLAGHRSIQTTQRYIDGDSDAQRKLVAMI
jgi:integrase